MPRPAPSKAIVHPLVLLSAVDHYNRVAKDTSKRVVGVLLGSLRRHRHGAEEGEVVVDISNSFAVPFEEDPKSADVWFVDHNYIEQMHAMFRKVNATEKIVGWYSTGPLVRPNDISIHEAVFQKYCHTPVFTVIDVRPGDSLEIPTKSYIAREEVKEDASEAPSLQFHHISSEIGALEAEEVGVEHLLRDVRDTTISTLSQKVDGQVATLRSLVTHIDEMERYLTAVVDGRAPPNHDVIGKIQDIFNLSPNLNVEHLARAFNVQSNDSNMVVFLASLARSITALHDLIDNKVALRAAEAVEDKKGKQQKDKAASAAATAGEMTD